MKFSYGEKEVDKFWWQWSANEDKTWILHHVERLLKTLQIL